MKIEKINENQIKCTLNKKELESRHININELAHGNEETKLLFQDMMQQAATLFGFDTENLPLMIEAVPQSNDGIILLVTKVTNTQDLDSHIPHVNFEKDNDTEAYDSFEDYEEYLDDMEEINTSEDVPISDSDTLLDVFQKIKEKAASLNKNQKDNFVPLQKLFTSQTSPSGNTTNILSQRMIRIYSFDNLNTIITLSGYLQSIYNGQNSLYKCLQNDRYYLILDKSSHTMQDFAIICTIISEYGKTENSMPVYEAYYKEHFKKIISKKALQKLQTII